ncbi:hypothetical protein BC834DRAFT_850345 [Gloeopeniophorella convolvens]|nr:hypothetical protein BC834DRAFT_850345 [Gloeopeniophorella convolvens]
MYSRPYKPVPVELETAHTQYDMVPATGTIALNNFLQGRGKLTSLSWVDTQSGPAHAPEWNSVCKIDGQEVSSGTGTHKHLSRDAAADAALAILMLEWNE